MENTEERQQAEKIREARRQLLADLIAEDGGVRAVVTTQNGEKHCGRCDETILESFDYCPRCGSLLKW